MLGEQVGQYQVTGKLGEGGMGAVYLAQHVLIGRPAAIKVLKSEYSHRPEVVERFFNEARAASAIRHPGIVEIYDFGYHVDDSAYIVMEHLEGESLEARMRRLARLPIDRALELIRQVASGLAAAHDKQIVHRDLKPDNIFVVPDPDIPGGERTKILDFGIAKLVTQGGPGSYKTSTGTVMGTPAYMAPEQCKGAGRVDRRADLYALGCILFEMLCGQPPFVAEGGGEVMAQHIYASPPSPLAFDPTIPAGVDAVIQRLLTKEPDQRYQSARDVMAAIDALANRPSQVGGVPVAIAASTGPDALVAEIAAPTPEPKTTLGAAAGSMPPGARRRSRAGYLAPMLAALVLAAGGLIFAVTRGGGAGGRVDIADGAPAPDHASATGEISAGAAGEALTAPSSDAGSSTGAESTTGSEARSDDTSSAVSGVVEISIDSKPRGADVYKQPLGLRVGPTPYHVEQPAAQGELVYVLKKAGYRTKEVVLPGDRNSSVRIELQRHSSGTRSSGSADTSASHTGAKTATATESGAGKPAAASSTGTEKPASPGDRGVENPAASSGKADGSHKGRSLNPFEKKKPKEPKPGKGRNLNPFEK